MNGECHHNQDHNECHKAKYVAADLQSVFVHFIIYSVDSVDDIILSQQLFL